MLKHIKFCIIGAFMNFIVMIIAVSLTLASLTGCQSTSGYKQKLQKFGPVYLDEQFKNYANVKIESEKEIFALDDNMKMMVAKELTRESNNHKKVKKLLKHFFSPEQLNLTYNTGANVIASKAYQNKEANCLSLTIMAYAIAKASDLDVVFQSVQIPEYWVRNGQMNMLTGHVNLRVMEKISSNQVIFFERGIAEIDFDPFVLKKIFPKNIISKNRVISMFYNNKGANAMVSGDYITAYAYLKAATEIDPKFSSAWGNLGILYRFNDYEQLAIETYQYAISINGNNLTSMSNLSLLLHRNGDYEQAKQLDAFIMRKRANNPYYYALLGDENFYRGDYYQAISNYRRAIKLNKNVHEFYFGLAKVHYMLDDIEKAQSYMKKAIAKNRIKKLDQLYAAKLDLLRQSKG
jgi:tetratricopeptide (TPR) repeat protein